jgi:putative holliday junction resolvase
MRVLGVDYGTKRIGLALSDPLGIFAQPLQALAVSDLPSAADEIARITKERDVDTIVIGLPRNMDGTIGEKAQEALAFLDMLLERTHVVVVPWDERLSTAFAERALRESNMSRKKRKKRVDMVAAQVILQGYLDSRKNAPPADQQNESPA